MQQDEILNNSKRSEALHIGKADYPLVITFPVAAFVLVFTTALAISLSFYSESEKLVADQKARELYVEGNLVEPLLEQMYSQSLGDFFFLSKIPLLRKLIEADASDDSDDVDYRKNLLGEVFSRLLLSKGIYSRVSLIGTDNPGQHIVTAIRRDAGITVLRAAELQNDSEKSFFVVGKTLPLGKSYFSKIEFDSQIYNDNKLNRSTLHVSTPVYNHISRKVYAVLVISIDFNTFNIPLVYKRIGAHILWRNTSQL